MIITSGRRTRRLKPCLHDISSQETVRPTFSSKLAWTVRRAQKRAQRDDGGIVAHNVFVQICFWQVTRARHRYDISSRYNSYACLVYLGTLWFWHARVNCATIVTWERP
ncbi:hypothetical protein PLICRDRAFT_204211 [Plicaturopsis crispa FD-325 SS-3]|nr:hypothetical protein PLICRDRAFT_204211 [Plicaturopsis crispa FD-325 SS-3]